MRLCYLFNLNGFAFILILNKWFYRGAKMKWYKNINWNNWIHLFKFVRFFKIKIFLFGMSNQLIYSTFAACKTDDLKEFSGLVPSQVNMNQRVFFWLLFPNSRWMIFFFLLPKSLIITAIESDSIEIFEKDMNTEHAEMVTSNW